MKKNVLRFFFLILIFLVFFTLVSPKVEEEMAILADAKTQKNTGRNTLNLTNLVTWCSGGVGLTLECYHGCYTKSGKIHECTFSQLMAPAFISLKTIMKEGLVEPLAPRNL